MPAKKKKPIAKKAAPRKAAKKTAKKTGKKAAKKAASKKAARSATTKASARPAPSTKSLAAKLQLKAPMRVRVVGGPSERLGVLPAGVASTDGGADAVVLFVEDSAALAARLDDAVQALRGALFWVCYPKGGGAIASDLNRDVLWKKMAPHGFRPVAQVAVDATWSAMRFKTA